MNPKTQPFVVFFFLALLTAAYGLNKANSVHDAAVPSDNEAQKKALARYGFAFEEVAQQVGVKFQHEAPVLDAKLAHIMPQIASMGAGVAVADFDRDGWNDFYVCNSAVDSKNALYRNKGDGTFEDVAEKMGVADLNQENGTSMGAVWGDYDNDGFEDLLVYKWGRPELFHNDGGKGFTNVTTKANLPRWVNANNAIWFDYDRDGKLDIFIGGYYREDINLWKLKSTDIMPESFEYAQNGGRKYLLRGQGDGTFEDVTQKAGLISRRWALAAVAGDFRGTGYPDLVIANDYGVTEFFANDKGRFREIGRQVGIGFAPKSGMNANTGDVLNSGAPAIYISNITEPNILNQRNNLWVPREGSKGTGLRYDNLADNMGVGDGGWSFGAVFGDFNNDGAQDLYCTNGYVSGDRQKSYWYDYSKITGANTAIIRDDKNWPPMGTNSLSGYQSKRVWINDGAGSFKEVAQNVGVRDKFDGRAVAVADLWNRGTLDVIVANQKGPLLIYKNSVQPDRNWIQFELRGQNNRSAIGAHLTLYWDGKKQTQILAGGEGFCSQNMRRLHFGLGEDAKIEKAVVRWPSGRVQTITDFKMNQINTITEAASAIKTGGVNSA